MISTTKYKQSHSTLVFAESEGRRLVVKRHLATGWRTSAESVRRQTEIEAAVVRNLALLPPSGGRLGRLSIVESDSAAARVVMEVAPGKPLEEHLFAAARGADAGAWRGVLSGFVLAGRWQRAFQELPPPGCASRARPAEELEEVCADRLETLADLGFEPLCRRRARHILDWVRMQVRATPGGWLAPTWQHGDFGPFNLLWDGYQLTPIDFATCRLDLPLLDLTYLVHRIELLPIQFPWRRWPVQALQRAAVRGFGRPEATHLPIFRALAARHWLCRLQSLVRRPAAGWKQKLHNGWVRRQAWSRLVELTSRP